MRNHLAATERKPRSRSDIADSLEAGLDCHCRMSQAVYGPAWAFPRFSQLLTCSSTQAVCEVQHAKEEADECVSYHGRGRTVELSRPSIFFARQPEPVSEIFGNVCLHARDSGLSHAC